MDLRKTSKFAGLLTKRFSVDSTSTLKSYKDEPPKVKKKIRKSKIPVKPLDYGDDDALVESGLWSDIKVMLWDFIPDFTPLNFVLMQLFVYLVFLSFRPLTFPEGKDPVQVDDEVQIQYEHLSYIKDYFDNDENQHELIINTLKLVFLLLLINLIVLFIVLLVRFLFMKFLFEPLSKVSRFAVLIAYSVDPSIFYVLWSLLNYTIFLRWTMSGDTTDTYTIYEFRMFAFYLPKSFWIDSKCYSWTKTVYHLHILFSVRKLILTSFLFFFELQFLANYATDLTTYLNELSCLRKFTLKWLNYVYRHKAHKIYELDVIMEKFRNTDMSIVKKSYNTIWMQHSKDDFKIFRPILSKWQHHNIKNDLDLSDYNGTDFLKDFWINSMSIKPSVNWIVLNYVIHNPPEILMLHHSIQLLSKETIDYCSKILFDQIYETLTLLTSKESMRLAHLRPKEEEVEVHTVEKECGDYVGDEQDDFYRFEEPAEKVYRLSHLPGVEHVDQLHVTADYEPGRTRKFKKNNAQKVPELMRYRSTICNPDEPLEKQMNALMSFKDERQSKTDEEDEDNRYITKVLCANLDQRIVDDFFVSYDISNCGAISYQNFTTTVINMCSIRKKLITTLKNQRSILELVGNLISIILWFMSFVALLLSFRINKNIVLPSTIGLFSATIVALSYMYTSFITAIMFVVISNPYNVGDRVRIDGNVMYVRRITTYNTEFRSSHGKHVIYQNILLSKMLIINESRAKHATLEVNITISTSTTPVALKMLRDNVKTFVNGRPRDFINNSIFFHLEDLQIAHSMELVIWATCVETWSNPLVVFGLRTDLMKFVANQCKLLGITFEEALRPLEFKNTMNLGGFDNFTTHFGVSGGHAHDKAKKEKKEDKTHRSAGPSICIVESKTMGAYEHPVPPPPPPASPLKDLFTRTLERQESVGPLSIEPPFPGGFKEPKSIRGARAPPAPRPSTLKSVPKNAPVPATLAHPLPKKTDVEDYENVWLNTWSPENRPNRAKTLSFESSYEKEQMLLPAQEETNDNPEETAADMEPVERKGSNERKFRKSGEHRTSEDKPKTGEVRFSSRLRPSVVEEAPRISDEKPRKSRTRRSSDDPPSDEKRRSSKARSSSESRDSANAPRSSGERRRSRNSRDSDGKDRLKSRPSKSSSRGEL